MFGTLFNRPLRISSLNQRALISGARTRNRTKDTGIFNPRAEIRYRYYSSMQLLFKE